MCVCLWGVVCLSQEVHAELWGEGCMEFTLWDSKIISALPRKPLVRQQPQTQPPTFLTSPFFQLLLESTSSSQCQDAVEEKEPHIFTNYKTIHWHWALRVMLKLHKSYSRFAYIAVKLECVVTEWQSPWFQRSSEHEESQGLAAFKTNMRNISATETKWNLRQADRPWPYKLRYYKLLYVCIRTVDG